MKLHPSAALFLLLLGSAGCTAHVELADGALEPGAGHVDPGNGEAPASKVARVSGKWAHVCSIDATGHLHCWGQNIAGELGVPGAAAFEPAPLPVDPEHTYRALSAGVATTCAIRSEGSLWCWGRNHGGPLATGDAVARDAPVQIGGDQDWEQVTMGSGMACGIRSGGRMYCWGGEDLGYAADMPLSPKALKEPTLVEGRWIALSSHWYRTMAIRDDGSVWASPNSGVFSSVQGSPGHAREISVGVLYALVVDETGALYHLEFGESEEEVSPTLEVPGVPFGGAMASAYGACSISSDRRMYCTGDLTYKVQQLAPFGEGAPRWTSVGVGNRFGCGSAEDGAIWCWGTLHSDGMAPPVEYGDLPARLE